MICFYYVIFKYLLLLFISDFWGGTYQTDLYAELISLLFCRQNFSILVAVYRDKRFFRLVFPF